jgi:hypothetical protein
MAPRFELNRRSCSSIWAFESLLDCRLVAEHRTRQELGHEIPMTKRCKQASMKAFMARMS